MLWILKVWPSCHLCYVKQWNDDRSNELHGLHRCAAIFAHGRTFIIIANSSVDNLRLSWLLCSSIQAENQLFTSLSALLLSKAEMHEKRPFYSGVAGMHHALIVVFLVKILLFSHKTWLTVVLDWNFKAVHKYYINRVCLSYGYML